MKPMSLLLFTLLLFTLLSVHPPAQAEVYKWVDENGKAHFSDKAPEKQAAETIGESLEKTNVDTSSKNTAVGTRNTEKTQDELEYEQKKEAEKQAAIANRCARLKQDMTVIASGARVAFYDDKGKEYTVLEKDRDKKLEEWKAAYKKLGCK